MQVITGNSWSFDELGMKQQTTCKLYKLEDIQKNFQYIAR